ncbi:hypothetical protein GUJ93_ZPchr0007g4719 [Zizania palustris]|uniref:Uncharacterized protein n=1 Tax=Zizania palustris TaxID=103762 RepID=A0A8J5TEE1_ZIZPA|nr:hypothetical protein GUJ93_ZPchr0007g4719 [Zizania palustris]
MGRATGYSGVRDAASSQVQLHMGIGVLLLRSLLLYGEAVMQQLPLLLRVVRKGEVENAVGGGIGADPGPA